MKLTPWELPLEEIHDYIRDLTLPRNVEAWEAQEGKEKITRVAVQKKIKKEK